LLEIFIQIGGGQLNIHSFTHFPNFYNLKIKKLSKMLNNMKNMKDMGKIDLLRDKFTDCPNFTVSETMMFGSWA
jgi:hypothetical protein